MCLRSHEAAKRRNRRVACVSVGKQRLKVGLKFSREPPRPRLRVIIATRCVGGLGYQSGRAAVALFAARIRASQTLRRRTSTPMADSPTKRAKTKAPEAVQQAAVDPPAGAGASSDVFTLRPRRGVAVHNIPFHDKGSHAPNSSQARSSSTERSWRAAGRSSGTPPLSPPSSTVRRRLKLAFLLAGGQPKKHKDSTPPHKHTRRPAPNTLLAPAVPVEIHSIRQGRDKPGLRPQHLTGLQLIERLSGAPTQSEPERTRCWEWCCLAFADREPCCLSARRRVPDRRGGGQLPHPPPPGPAAHGPLHGRHGDRGQLRPPRAKRSAVPPVRAAAGARAGAG